MAEGNQKDKIEGLIEDTELDGILDDALLDYDAPSKPIPKTEAQHSDGAVPQECNSLLTDALDPANLEELNSMMEGILGKDLLKEYEIFSKELEQQLPDMFDLQGLEEDLFRSSSMPNPQFKPTNRIPSCTTRTTTDETIQDLNKNLETARSGVPPVMGLEEGGEQMLGMVKDLMGDLLSEEVLYEPMKDLCLQYPKYLDEEELNEEDRKRYSRQFVVMQEICREYESSRDTASQQHKPQRQERLLRLVQELQGLGNPPSALVDDPAIPDLSQLTQSPNLCNQQ